jgi:hypothetical protein
MIDDAWVERIYQAWAEEQASLSEDQAGLLSSDNEQQFFFGIDEIAPKLTPGYITGDACKGKGDDTLHSPRKLVLISPYRLLAWTQES